MKVEKSEHLEFGEQTGFIHIGVDSLHKFPSLGTLARIIGFLGGSERGSGLEIQTNVSNKAEFLFQIKVGVKTRLT